MSLVLILVWTFCRCKYLKRSRLNQVNIIASWNQGWSTIYYVENISNIGFYGLLRTVKFYFKTSTGSWNLWSAEVEFVINKILQTALDPLNMRQWASSHSHRIRLVTYRVFLLSNLVNSLYISISYLICTIFLFYYNILVQFYTFHMKYALSSHSS